MKLYKLLNHLVECWKFGAKKIVLVRNFTVFRSPLVGNVRKVNIKSIFQVYHHVIYGHMICQVVSMDYES